jgi:hypothetical protein
MRPGSLASPRFSWNGASRFEATVPLRAGLAGAVSCTRLPSGGNGNCRQNLFAQDSSLEEAVFSELVSEAKFPASWENTGNFVRLGLRVRLLARNPGTNSMAYDPIPYASEQGIYFGLAGN